MSMQLSEMHGTLKIKVINGWSELLLKIYFLEKPKQSIWWRSIWSNFFLSSKIRGIELASFSTGDLEFQEKLFQRQLLSNWTSFAKYKYQKNKVLMLV